MVVQEGQLGNLRCPEPSCDQLINRQVSLSHNLQCMTASPAGLHGPVWSSRRPTAYRMTKCCACPAVTVGLQVTSSLQAWLGSPP